jgi:hypothetical protein
MSTNLVLLEGKLFFFNYLSLVAVIKVRKVCIA